MSAPVRAEKTDFEMHRLERAHLTLGCLLLRDVELPHRPGSLFPSPSSATVPTEVGVRE